MSIDPNATVATSLTSLDTRETTLETRMSAAEAAVTAGGAIPEYVVAGDQLTNTIIGYAPDPFTGAGVTTFASGNLPGCVKLTDGGILRKASGTLSPGTVTPATITASRAGHTDVSYQVKFHQLGQVFDIWGDQPNPAQNAAIPVGHNVTVTPGTGVAKLHMRSIGPLNTGLWFNVRIINAYMLGQQGVRSFFMAPNAPGQLSELVIDLPYTDATIGQSNTIQIDGINIGGPYGFNKRDYAFTCGSSASAEPETLTQVDPYSRIKKKVGRDPVYVMPEAETMAWNPSNQTFYGEVDLATGRPVKFSTGPNTNIAPGGSGNYGNETNGAVPLVAENGRMKLNTVKVTTVGADGVTRSHINPDLNTKGAFHMWTGYWEVVVSNWNVNQSMIPAVWAGGPVQFLNSEIDIMEYNLARNMNLQVTMHYIAAYAPDFDAQYLSGAKTALGFVAGDQRDLFKPGDAVKFALDWTKDASGQIWMTILYNDLIVYQCRNIIGFRDGGTQEYRRQPLFLIVASEVGGHQLLGLPSPEASQAYVDGFDWTGGAYFYLEDWQCWQSAAERAEDAQVKADLRNPTTMALNSNGNIKLPNNTVQTNLPVRAMRLYPYPGNATTISKQQAFQYKLRIQHGVGPFTIATNLTSTVAGITGYSATGVNATVFQPLTGTNTTAGTIAGTVTVTDANGKTATHTINLTAISVFVPSDLSNSIADFDLSSASSGMTANSGGEVTGLVSTDGAHSGTVIGTPVFEPANHWVITGGSGFRLGVGMPYGSFTVAILTGIWRESFILDTMSGPFFSLRYGGAGIVLGQGIGKDAQGDGGGSQSWINLYVWVFDSASSTIRCWGDGAELTIVQGNTLTLSSTLEWQATELALDVGQRGSPGLTLNGGIYLRSAASTTAERQKIEGAIMHRAARASQLSSSHPYKSAPPAG